MSRYLDGTEAFNIIAQRVDETLIQADALLRSLRMDGEACKSVESLPDLTVVPHRDTSERSCSPDPSRCSKKRHSSSSSSSKSAVHDVHVKSKSYVALDKKKAVVLTSLKSKTGIEDSEVLKIQKLIEGLFGAQSASSASFLQL